MKNIKFIKKNDITEIRITGYDGYAHRVDLELDNDEINYIKTLIEKNEPAKFIEMNVCLNERGHSGNIHIYRCPNCGEIYTSLLDNYCSNCGQRFKDWI